MTKTLFHASTWEALSTASFGDQLTLVPGSQGAEGQGVYFAEGSPRIEASDSVYHSGNVAGVVVIECATAKGWWRTKPGRARKYGRPRTWHSAGKSVDLTVKELVEVNGINHIYCDWSFQ